MFEPSPAWPHGELREFAPDLFFVVGTNKVQHAGIDLQTSRTMLVVREAAALTLVNTVRLDDAGLAALDAVGQVKHVMRLGAFHGRDDPFYRDRYAAQLWALPGSSHADGRAPDRELDETSELPIRGARLLEFQSSRHPEAALWLPHSSGTLVTCDAIQNWSGPDSFFAPDTFAMFDAQGLIREANIPATWLGACEPSRDDFERLLALEFRHVVTAHGEPLLDHARERIRASVERAFARAGR
jgi:hypothetical protein